MASMKIKLEMNPVAEFLLQPQRILVAAMSASAVVWI
jgi:hypothetical protein